MRNLACLLVTLLAGLFLCQGVSAEVANQMSYQGRLTTPSGTAVPNGSYQMRFIIWDAASGGTEIWNSGLQSVPVSEGLFTVSLGAPPMPAIPPAIWWDSTRYLGVTVGTDPEMTPRTRLTSVYASYLATFSTYSYHSDASEWAKKADTAQWSMLQEVPAGFADGVDNDAGGDITSVTVGAGLTGGGTGGAVTVAADAGYLQRRVTGTAPAGNAISAINADGSISTTAVGNGDITSVTAGTALTGGGTSGDVTLGLASTITSSHTFADGTIHFGDSTMKVNENGISVGTPSYPSTNNLIYIGRGFNSTSLSSQGIWAYLINRGSSSLYGARFEVGSTSSAGDGGGARYGVSAIAMNDPVSTNPVYGVYGYAFNPTKTTGAVYGVYGAAERAVGPNSFCFGIYGYKGGTSAGYAGYFLGGVGINGTLSKTAGSFKIDHPLDPENKYLQHSFVESPDMMNIYNGNVVLDADGSAVVTLPSYFEALNINYRYQLTAIGAPGPNLYVSQKVTGNQFRIAGGVPGMEVSWQITGVRQDAYAKAHPIEVEIEKLAGERGTYVSPEEHGQPLSKHVNWEQIKEAKERQAEDASGRQ